MPRQPLSWSQALTGAVLLSFAPMAAPVAAQEEGEVLTCPAPVGTLAVYEPRPTVLDSLGQFDLESPTSLIRMMVQQSNCFIVVERGRAMEGMARERALNRDGELTTGSEMGAGQMQAADFYLTPEVLFSEGNAGGIGGVLGGVIGRRVGIAGGGLKFKEAETSILIANTRSGVQVAAAQGKARETDFALGAISWAGGMAGGLGGYSNTNEGKVIANSFLDNYNQIVRDIADHPNLRPLTPEEVQARINGEPAPGRGFQEGDVVYPKIDNVEVFVAPDRGSEVVAAVLRTEALVFLGGEENGYLEVQSSAGVGWIRAVLVERP